MLCLILLTFNDFFILTLHYFHNLGDMMIYKVTKQEDLQRILDFIGSDFYNCPYLYLNIHKYGLDETKVSIYIDEIDDEIRIVALFYYDCLHVYYKCYSEDIESEVHILVKRLQPRTIYVSSFKNSVLSYIDGYKGKEVLVMSPQYFLDIDTSIVKNATLADLPGIAKFMYSFWSDVYISPEVIWQQIRERMNDGFGRTKYIDVNGECVACVSSFAELSNFAICSGLLVSDSQRGKKLGSILLKSIYQELENEGKRTCGIIVEDYSRIFHEKNGFSIVGKLIKYNRLFA